MNDNILEPNINGLPPITDWQKVFLVLQQANEAFLRGATLPELGKQIIGDVQIQGADFVDLPVAETTDPVALPIPETGNKFGFLADGKFTQPTGGTLEYSATQWGLTLFDGDKWVKKFTLDLPKNPAENEFGDSTTNPISQAKATELKKVLELDMTEDVLYKNFIISVSGTLQSGTGTMAFIKLKPNIDIDILRDQVLGNRFRVVSLSTPVDRDPAAGDSSTDIINDASNTLKKVSINSGNSNWIGVYLNSTNPFNPAIVIFVKTLGVPKTNILSKDSDLPISSKGAYVEINPIKEILVKLVTYSQKSLGLSTSNTLLANASKTLFFKVSENDPIKISRPAVVGDRFTIFYVNKESEPVAGDPVTVISSNATLLEYNFKSAITGWVGIYFASPTNSDTKPVNVTIESKFKKGELSKSSGGSYDTSVIEMERGSLNSSGRYPYTHTAEWRTSEFYKNFRSSLFIHLSSSLNSSIEINKNDLLDFKVNVLQYNSQFTLIGLSTIETNTANLINGAEYIKIHVTKSDGTDITSLPSVKVSGVFQGEKFCYNAGLYGTTIRTVIEVGNFNGRDMLDLATADQPVQYDSAKYYTHVLIRTPPNYDPNGKPVRVIYFAHSSSGADLGNFNPNYAPYVRYLADEGYMIIDVFAWTNKYPNGIQYMNTPTNIACTNAMYDFISRNFNIKRDGVFIFGKSHGGYQVYAAEYMFAFKTLAAASLAGAIHFANKNYGYHDPDRLASVQDLQVVEDPAPILSAAGSNYNAGARAWFRRNAKYFHGYIPLTLGSLNFDPINAFPDTALVGDQVMFTDLEFTAVSRTPTKTWVSPDDGNISVSGILARKRAVERGAGIFELRYMPSGTADPHHTVDTAGPFIPTITTKYGVIHENIPVAWAEMLQFFKRFEF